jgi:hypothetical protein
VFVIRPGRRRDVRRCRRCPATLAEPDPSRYCAEHAPRCRHCGVLLRPEVLYPLTVRRSVRHCPPCRAARERTKQERARRPLSYQGVVTAELLLATYLQCYRPAVRLASRIAGARDGEDVVQATFLYLWSRRDTLRAMTNTLFFLAVKRNAYTVRASAWARRVHSVGDTLEEIEKILEAKARGAVVSNRFVS